MAIETSDRCTSLFRFHNIGAAKPGPLDLANPRPQETTR